MLIGFRGQFYPFSFNTQHAEYYIVNKVCITLPMELRILGGSGKRILAWCPRTFFLLHFLYASPKTAHVPSWPVSCSHSWVCRQVLTTSALAVSIKDNFPSGEPQSTRVVAILMLSSYYSQSAVGFQPFLEMLAWSPPCTQLWHLMFFLGWENQSTS